MLRYSLIFAVISCASCTTYLHNLVKRGAPIAGGTSEYARQAGADAINEIRDNERVAEQSASSAVDSAVGRDYANQLATTAQFVAQFTAPVTKEQAQRTFDTIGNFQKAGSIGSALSNSNSAISDAARNAAHSNYEQALHAENAGYNRPSGGGGASHYGGGGGGGSGGGVWSSGGGGGGGGGGYSSPPASWA